MIVNDRKVKRGSDTRPRKDFPYYKLQYFQERLQAWRDFPPAFQTLAELNDYRLKNAAQAQPTRIMIIEGERSRRILEDAGGDGG